MALVKCRLFASVFLLASIAVIEAADWTYDPVDQVNGPLVWKVDYPECAATRQSPINLVDDEVTRETFDDFVFQGYDSQEEDAGTLISIANLGHTARIALGGIFRISGGGLPTEYQAVQAHFHWGTISQQGSEHAINGRLFPLEMHIVHYDYQQYFTIRDAATSGNKDALAVLGILFEIDDEDNEYFDEVITGISNITYEGEQYTFQPEISLSNLLPEDTSRFYRYDGSLTTPPCYEVVQWTVFEDTVKISEKQVNYFRQLTEGLPRNESHPTGNTYRPLQPRRDRVVYRSYRESTEVGSTPPSTDRPRQPNTDGPSLGNILAKRLG